MKKLLAIALSSAMIVSMGSSAVFAEESTEGTSGEKYRIAICAMNPDNTWMAKHLENIEAECEKETDEFEYTLTAGKDAADQQAIIETYMTQDYDCIIVMPMDSTLLQDVCNRVYESGTPLIICERQIEGDNYLSYVGASDYECGKLAADYFGEVLGGEGKIAVLRNFVGSQGDAERYGGLVDVLEEKYPDIEIISEADAENSREKGYEQMSNMLAANDHIDAVYAQVDEAGLGALQAIENEQRTDIKAILGVGGCKEVFDLFGTDSQYTAISSFFPTMGALAIQTARAYLKGEEVEHMIIDPAYLVTEENVDEFYEFGP